MKPKAAFVAWAAATMLVAAPVLADGPAAGSAGSQVKADGSTKKLIIGILDVRVDGVPPVSLSKPVFANGTFSKFGVRLYTVSRFEIYGSGLSLSDTRPVAAKISLS